MEGSTNKSIARGGDRGGSGERSAIGTNGQGSEAGAQLEAQLEALARAGGRLRVPFLSYPPEAPFIDGFPPSGTGDFSF